jgi:hypothetical protein
LLKGNESGGEEYESEVIAGLSFPSDEKSPEAIVPAVGSFDDPPAGLAVDAPEQRRFAPSSNMRDDMAVARFVLRIAVVVALVEAKMDGVPRSPPSAKRHGIERRADHPLVVDISRGDRYGEGNTAPVGKDVPFDPFFRTIGRIGAGVVPPFGAFTMALSRLHHFQSTPRSAS